MAVSTKALTLAQWAKESKSLTQKAITKSFLSDVSILDYLTLKTNENLEVKGNRITEDGLPTLGYGRINKVPTDIKTTTEVYNESAVLIRGRIQIDRKLLKQKNWITSPVKTQTTGALTAARYQLNDDFFNGTPQDDPDQLIGIRHKLKNAVIYKVATGLRIDCGGVDMRIANMTAATALAFRHFINKAFAFLGVSDGRGCVAFTNWHMISAWEQAVMMQSPGGTKWSVAMDEFGSEVTKYRQCKIADIGFKLGNTSNPIFPLDESATGFGTTGGDRTSIVICRFGPDHLSGWQDGMLDVEDLGRSTEYGTYNNMLLDWAFGTYSDHNRYAVELFNIRTS